ncbi:hypothetical protein ACKKBF_B40690 [Auxenochlorella protothecoides x Auxenochlorella symbiontica]
MFEVTKSQETVRRRSAGERYFVKRASGQILLILAGLPSHPNTSLIHRRHYRLPGFGGFDRTFPFRQSRFC